jgi:hypothetical protein
MTISLRCTCLALPVTTVWAAAFDFTALAVAGPGGILITLPREYNLAVHLRMGLDLRDKLLHRSHHERNKRMSTTMEVVPLSLTLLELEGVYTTCCFVLLRFKKSYFVRRPRDLSDGTLIAVELLREGHNLGIKYFPHRTTRPP